MGYFDGNTVTAFWHYAQHFAMSDNAFADTYGPSTPGALNVVSGQTNGMIIVATTKKPSTLALPSYYINDGQGGYTMINDVDPAFDTCSSPNDQAMMNGKNIGDLLNAAGISWGGFMGGFNLTDLRTPTARRAASARRTRPSSAADITDYIPHHNWFQYYASTSNPTHARPSSLAAIGKTLEADGTTLDPANHEYDLNDFYDAVKAGNFPAVSYIKAPAYQDGHAGYSDPLDEQNATVDADQLPEETARLEKHRGHRRVGRLGRLVRSRLRRGDEPLVRCRRPARRPGRVRHRHGARGHCGEARPGPLRARHALAVSRDLTVGEGEFRRSHQISLASVVRFIEDNWLHGQRLGGGSFDATAGSIASLFDFTRTTPRPAAVTRAIAAATGAAGSVTRARSPCALLVAVRHRQRVGRDGARAAARRAALGDGATRTAHVLRPRALSSGRLSCADLPQPRARLRAAGRPRRMAGGPALTRHGLRAVPSLMYLERQPPFSIGPGRTAEAEGARRRRGAGRNLVPQGGLFWDGRADTLQGQALGPLLNPLEMDGGSVPRSRGSCGARRTRRCWCSCSEEGFRAAGPP